ncbi:hypothetical protein GCM10017044_02560 [Kordiimonas sediminis]|uniref:Uncharacterized protein n=1 Tax=Kordiimonas sediminis TaxID=1735581 RepID=A0A919AKM0_9PROT|nr:hypothetical protein [Kordiimonas sediminis]GHF12136.1 hypothetical protein GCM10017044_02560 [Kordiimonas sediminis]
MIFFARMLVVLSFVGGAFLASLDQYSMTWEAFIPVMVAGVIGLVLLKKLEGAAARSDDRLTQHRTDLEESLGNIVRNLEDLNGRKDKVPTYDMRFEIDKIFREDLMRFADARESMKHLFGLQHYADIMSSFAAGERYINRVWSASTDGYVDEVLMYVEKALYQFHHAAEEFEKATAEQSVTA